jgi:hypothetical protein
VFVRGCNQKLLLLVATLVSAACGGTSNSTLTPPPNHLACGASTTLTPGNTCCSDGQQRPDCSLTVSHTGYWELQCPAPLSTTCGATHTETFDLVATGVLTALYTTGPYHTMPGAVRVWLDGVAMGAFDAELPGGTVNPPLILGAVASGTHTIVLQFSSTDGGIPGSWGGFLDLFLKT